MPLVSVIIPNYNHAPYLKQRIDSVLNQTYQDFEVIILDDLSTDNSREIIEQYRTHPKISQIIYNDENSGSTFKQWNKGIGLAKGEWIWIAESDDYADLQFLEKLLLKITEEKDVVLIYCRSNLINSKGENIGSRPPNKVKAKDYWLDDYIHLGKYENEQIFYFRNIISNASSVLFKKVNFISIPKKLYFDMRYAGDWMVWINLIEHGKIYYLNKSLNFFRIHNSSTRVVKSLNQEKMRFLEIMDVIFFLKKKYKLKLNYGYHKWILDDWFERLEQLKYKPYDIFDNKIPKIYFLKYYGGKIKSKLFFNGK